MDGGWEWGRGGESGRGGFARTVVGTPAIGAAYRSCCLILRGLNAFPDGLGHLFREEFSKFKRAFA